MYGVRLSRTTKNGRPVLLSLIQQTLNIDRQLAGLRLFNFAVLALMVLAVYTLIVYGGLALIGNMLHVLGTFL